MQSISMPVFDTGYTRAQAAAVLGVSLSTIIRLEKEGKLKPVYLSKAKVRIERSELERYLKFRNKKKW